MAARAAGVSQGWGGVGWWGGGLMFPGGRAGGGAVARSGLNLAMFEVPVGTRAFIFTDPDEKCGRDSDWHAVRPP